MPLAAIAHVLVALFFGIHAIRTGRNMYWLMVLFMFPLLGSVVYFFAEYLPEMRTGRAARQAMSTVRDLVDPQREWREATADFERTPSVEHRSRLARALLALGRTKEAVEHYQACVSGPYARDSKFRAGLAAALLADGQAAAAADTLERLFADEPDAGDAANGLLHARAVAAYDTARAGAVFEQLLARHPTTDVQTEYGLHLAAMGRDAAARDQLEQVLKNARLHGEHSRQINREAIDRARAALAELDRRR